MIRIARGPEPQTLVAARVSRLDAAIKAFNQAGPQAVVCEGYAAKGVKEALYLAQYKKCAWCERRVDVESQPIEHYRPKAGACRSGRGDKPIVIDEEHYWWLTWTWENLLFACARCNDQGHKGNYFPLQPKSRPLPAPSRPIKKRGLSPDCFDVSRERPLLLDPAGEDPLDSIRWVPVNRPTDRRAWTWMPRPFGPDRARGRMTIEVLKLAALADDVQHHLSRHVVPRLEQIEAQLGAGKLGPGRKAWRSLLDDVLDERATLSAASWCALEIWMPAAQRERHGLDAPRRPGALAQR